MHTLIEKCVEYACFYLQHCQKRIKCLLDATKCSYSGLITSIALTRDDYRPDKKLTNYKVASSCMLLYDLLVKKKSEDN